MVKLQTIFVALASYQVVTGDFSIKRSTFTAIKSYKADDAAESPLARWMERKGVAVRICQRTEVVESYNNGISPTRESQATIGRCKARLVSTQERDSRTLKSCPGTQACIPIRSEVIHLRTDNRIKEFQNDLECSCVTSSSCKRHSSLRVFYRGTKFERVIDVGACAGNCGYKKCRPLSIKTVGIKTPNGRRHVEKITKCGCASSCYRMSYKKPFQIKNRNNETRTKVIDIGMCSGISSCSGTVQGKCLFWASGKQGDRQCIIRTNDRPRGCFADKTRIRTLNTLPNKEVNIIESCACS